jgi:FlaA1/EpsC-like NDP-sugar epimerase
VTYRSISSRGGGLTPTRLDSSSSQSGLQSAVFRQRRELIGASHAEIASAILGSDIPVLHSPQAQVLVEDSTVLVTGAGGSIGSELVRQMYRLGAAQVICVDRDEYALYRLQLGLTGQALLTDDSMILADVASRPQMEAVFAAFKPQIVFHAAACKQLPLLERAPAQAILTNVHGTMNVATLGATYGTRRFVNISTDKAARPTSVLGMTKRVAEIASAHCALEVETMTASVRFGNVFASRGSFIETIAHQVAAGLPVTVTDAEMSRFFMTIPQAVGLVIEAAVMADNSSIFTLDMGERHNIMNIVRRYALIAGIADVDIVCTGRRPGEKLTEELTGPGEIRHPTSHPAITAVPLDPNLGQHLPAIWRLVQAAAAGIPAGRLRAALAALANAPAVQEV